MNNALSFGLHSVRVTGTPDAPLFIAADVCAELELSNPSKSLDALYRDEKGLTITDTPGGPQQMLCVTESGLYHLIFKSRKDTAKRFRRWVTEEVLPEIRRNGSSLHASKSDPFESLLGHLNREMSDAIDAADEARHRIRMVAARRDEVIQQLRDAAPYDVTDAGAIIPTPFRVEGVQHEELTLSLMERFDLPRPRAMGIISHWILSGKANLNGSKVTIP